MLGSPAQYLLAVEACLAEGSQLYGSWTGYKRCHARASLKDCEMAEREGARAKIDPAKCETERTLDDWRQAMRGARSVLSYPGLGLGLMTGYTGSSGRLRACSFAPWCTH